MAATLTPGAGRMAATLTPGAGRMAATLTPGAGRMAATPPADSVKVKIEKSGKRKLFKQQREKVKRCQTILF